MSYLLSDKDSPLLPFVILPATWILYTLPSTKEINLYCSFPAVSSAGLAMRVSAHARVSVLLFVLRRCIMSG
jgi:hypothetical protein